MRTTSAASVAKSGGDAKREKWLQLRYQAGSGTSYKWGLREVALQKRAATTQPNSNSRNKPNDVECDG